MNTLVVFVALAAVSASALSTNEQPAALESWMSRMHELEASMIAQDFAKLEKVDEDDTSVPLSRVARNAGKGHGKGGFFKSCCGKEDLKYDHLKEHLTSCKDQHEGDKLNVIKCVGEKTEISDADGVITNADKFADTVSEMYEDDELKSKAKEASKKCVDDAINNHGKENKHGHKNVALIQGFMCVRMNVEASCPEEKQIKSEMCDKMRMGIAAKGGN